MKCLIDIQGGECTYECLFCHKKDGSYQKICRNEDKLNYYKIKSYIKKVVLKFDVELFHINSGFETMSFPYFKELLYYIQSLGNYKIILSTNSESISKSDNLDYFIETGVSKVYLPLYGFRDTHNFITNNNKSWDYLIASVEKLEKLKISYEFNSIVLKQNMNEITQLDSNFFGISYIFPFKSNKEYKNIVPDITKLNIVLRMKISNLFIPCFEIGSELIDISLAEKREIDLRINKNGILNNKFSRKNKMTYVKSCKSCKFYNNICTGFFKDYISVYKNIDVKPFK